MGVSLLLGLNMIALGVICPLVARSEGDFLRSGFVFVNYENSTVSIAQAAYASADLYLSSSRRVGSDAQAPLDF